MSSVLEPDAVRCYESAGNIVKKVRADIMPFIKKDAGLVDIAERIENEIIGEGGSPAFPCTIAINEIASHFTPAKDDERVLKSGDLVKLDFGTSVEGYIADAAFTTEIDSNVHAQLIRTAEKALAAGISMVKPGVYVGEIGRAIDEAASREGFRVLKDLLGHSLLRYRLHGGLTIPNYDNGSDMRVREGDVLAIEPFVTSGNGAINRVNGGNIYQLLRNGVIYAQGPGEKELLEYITGHYRTFPFAGRWLPGTDGLEGLMNAACIRSFPIMIEADGAPVAQAESTVIVGQKGCKIIT
jgi:methionyl aminopeptidase